MSDGAKAQVINPPHTLAKAKSGSGPAVLDYAAIERAEAAIEKAGEDYEKWAVEDIAAMEAALQAARAKPERGEEMMREIFRRALDLKGQGGSFGYILVTQIGDSLKNYTEALERLGKREVEIITAHIGALKTVLSQDIKGDGGELGRAIVAGLNKLTYGR